MEVIDQVQDSLKENIQYFDEGMPTQNEQLLPKVNSQIHFASDLTPKSMTCHLTLHLDVIFLMLNSL